MTTDSDTHSTDVQSLDTVFALLRDRRRRLALHALADRKGPVPLTDLAEAVAAHEAAGADGASRYTPGETAAAPASATSDAAPASPTADGTPAATDEVAEALYHVHLPKLADAGVIDYDEADDTVTLARPGAVAPFLDAVEDGE